MARSFEVLISCDRYFLAHGSLLPARCMSQTYYFTAYISVYLFISTCGMTNLTATVICSQQYGTRSLY